MLALYLQTMDTLVEGFNLYKCVTMGFWYRKLQKRFKISCLQMDITNIYSADWVDWLIESHCNPTNGWWDVPVWTKTVDQPIDQHRHALSNATSMAIKQTLWRFVGDYSRTQKQTSRLGKGLKEFITQAHMEGRGSSQRLRKVEVGSK